MRLRFGFVSNSSSTAFMITNTSDKNLTLKDFVAENKQLIDEYNEEYNSEHTLEEVLSSCDEWGLSIVTKNLRKSTRTYRKIISNILFFLKEFQGYTLYNERC